MDVRRNLQIPVVGLAAGGAAARTIERVLASTDGVLRAWVDPATGTAVIDYDLQESDPWTLARAIERAGFRAGAPVADAGTERS